MAFKLIESAQQRWRCINAPHLVPLVRAGARFDNGKLIEQVVTIPWRSVRSRITSLGELPRYDR